MQRYDIEGRSDEYIAEVLKEAFDRFCSAPGPSISPENFAKIIHAKMCGSKIPLFKG